MVIFWQIVSTIYRYFPSASTESFYFFIFASRNKLRIVFFKTLSLSQVVVCFFCSFIKLASNICGKLQYLIEHWKNIIQIWPEYADYLIWWGKLNIHQIYLKDKIGTTWFELFHSKAYFRKTNNRSTTTDQQQQINNRGKISAHSPILYYAHIYGASLFSVSPLRCACIIRNGLSGNIS